MANAERGQIEIKLGGETLLLEANFEALAEAESRAECGITAIAQRFAKSNVGIKDVTALVYGGLVGAGERRFSYQQVGNMVRKAGVLKILPQVSAFLSLGLRGDDSEAPEGQAGTA